MTRWSIYRGDSLTRKEIAMRKIIEASLIEFGTKGYELASTNSIYKAAGVSKGSIFLYFKSKAELFYEVFKYYLIVLNDELNKLNFDDINDVFDKMMEVVLWKMKYFSTRPLESKVLMEAVLSPPKEVEAKIMSHIDELTILSTSYLFKDIDMNHFSSDYSKDEVLDYIQIGLNGLQHEIINKGNSFDNYDLVRKKSLKFIKTLLKGMEK